MPLIDEDMVASEIVAADGTVLGTGYTMPPSEPMTWWPSPEVIASMISEDC